MKSSSTTLKVLPHKLCGPAPLKGSIIREDDYDDNVSPDGDVEPIVKLVTFLLLRMSLTTLRRRLANGLLEEGCRASRSSSHHRAIVV